MRENEQEKRGGKKSFRALEKEYIVHHTLCLSRLRGSSRIQTQINFYSCRTSIRSLLICKLSDNSFSTVCLCVSAIKASDYLEIARHFDTVIIHNVPRLKDLAVRLVTLINILYILKVKRIRGDIIFNYVPCLQVNNVSFSILNTLCCNLTSSGMQ